MTKHRVIQMSRRVPTQQKFLITDKEIFFLIPKKGHSTYFRQEVQFTSHEDYCSVGCIKFCVSLEDLYVVEKNNSVGLSHSQSEETYRTEHSRQEGLKEKNAYREM